MLALAPHVECAVKMNDYQTGSLATFLTLKLFLKVIDARRGWLKNIAIKTLKLIALQLLITLLRQPDLRENITCYFVKRLQIRAACSLIWQFG